jgi:peptidoglycan/LPS O-acetylase OafA/YrhL
VGAIRLFLALVVAIGHLQGIVLQPAGLGVPGYYMLGMNAGYAVLFFYVISGFLMSMVLSEKYSATLQGTLQFYKSRFIRIFSLYWPMALLIIILSTDIRNAFLAASPADKLTNIFVIGMDWRIPFADYPSEHWEAAVFGLRQAWTLSAELAFYFVAPFVLRSRVLTVAALVGSAMTRAYAVHATGFDPRWTYYFLPSTFLFFIIGHIVYRASRRTRWLDTGVAGAILLSSSVVFLLVPTYAEWDSFRFWCSVLCFALSLPGTFAATQANRWFTRIGDLSYPVYMVHLILLILLINVGLFPVLPRSGTFITLLFCGLTVITAVAAHEVMEKPTAALFRKLLSRGPLNRATTAEAQASV